MWDEDTANGWVDLASTITYDAWTRLTISFTGSAFEFGVNGTTVYTDNTIDNTTTGFGAVIMQAYNFADPSITGPVNAQDYTANWSNVPEPGFYGLLTVGSAA